MTQHHANVVVGGNGGVVVEQLLHVVAEFAHVALLNGTACGIKLSVVGVVDIGTTSLVEVHGTIHGEYQTVHQGEVCETRSVEGVTFVVTSVEQHILNWVGVLDEATAHAGIGVVTIVHHLNAIAINLDGTVGIADIHRIDRSNLSGESPGVTCRGLATVVAQRVVVEAGIRNVTTNLHPFLYLIVGTQTGGETLHVTVLHQTFVLQITQ